MHINPIFKQFQTIRDFKKALAEDFYEHQAVTPLVRAYLIAIVKAYRKRKKIVLVEEDF